MKIEKRSQARVLRQQGRSLSEITQTLGVAKSSVSLWVRDVQLNTESQRALSNKPYARDAVEKRRTARLTREAARRELILTKAASEIAKISSSELFILGVGLYWAEGAKTRRSIVQFTNSDKRLIEIMMVFFRTFCAVPESKFRGHIHLHEHLSSGDAIDFWSNVTGIPQKQFFKTSIQHKRSVHGSKDTLPLGTFSIYVCDTNLHLRIQGWMKGLHEQLTT